MGQQQVLAGRHRALHSHTSPNHSWVTAVSSHPWVQHWQSLDRGSHNSVGPERRSWPSDPWGQISGSQAKLLHLVHQSQVLHTDFTLTLCISPFVCLPHLLQNGACWPWSQEGFVGGVRGAVVYRKHRTSGFGLAGGVWRGEGERVWAGVQ